MSGDIGILQKAGIPEKETDDIILSLVRGLCGFLFNCPLDMLIERQIHEKFPLLQPAQFMSVRKLALEAWQANSNQEIRRFTPRKILQSSLALNGAYALFLDGLFRGASDFATPYRRLESFTLSQSLWRHWEERAGSLDPGGEYRLVDEFADMTGLRSWYEWQPDPGSHYTDSIKIDEGVSNEPLLKEKQPAAVFFLLDAIKRFKAMTPQQVRKTSFEIALLGNSGFDYASSEEKYEVDSIPGEKFSGLHLMCLMYAGFKQVSPGQDLGMDLNEPFLTALEMFNHEKEKGG